MSQARAESSFVTDVRDFDILLWQYSERIPIIAEGDSWFMHPQSFSGASDILSELNSDPSKLKYNILNLAYLGDKMATIGNLDTNKTLRRVISRYKNRGKVPLLMLSGGGNDILLQLNLLLKSGVKSSDPKDFFHQGKLAALYGKVEEAYENILEECGNRFTVIGHTYCYARASGKGSGTLWGRLLGIGPWLKPAFNKKEITNPGKQSELIRYLIDRFHHTIHTVSRRSLSRRSKLARFVVVDLRKYCTHSRYWVDELHLNRKGFEQVVPIVKKRINYLHKYAPTLTTP